MRSIRFIFSILYLTFVSSASAQRLSINISQIDSLHLPYTLSELIADLKNKVSIDETLLFERQWSIIKGYYNFNAAKEELEILSKEISNLKAIWELNKDLAHEGEISDVQLLTSHNAYLNKKSDFISKKNGCRNYLLEIVKLCYMKILEDKESINEEKKDKTSD